jgi:hypothetical protein
MHVTRKVIPVLLTIAMVTALMFVFAMPVGAHYPGAVIQSNWAAVTPNIDGVFGGGEWSDATIVDLQAEDPNNEIEAYVYFKNDGDYLYALVDVAGDTTEGGDESTLSFDTGHDAAHTDGHEDTFSWHFTEFDHWVWNSTAGEHSPCCHFDPALPLHTGLAGAIGFGPSPNNAVNHVIYEYRIPLALILASPGDTIGFAMDGEWDPFLGIYDDGTGLGDQWPFLRWGVISIDEYGDLILATGATGAIIVGVGGEAYAVNTFSLLAPWLGLALVLAVGGGVLVRRRRVT